MPASAFEQGKDTFSFDIVTDGVGRRSVVGTLRKMKRARAVLAFEHGNHDGTLFTLDFTMDDFLQAEAGHASLPIMETTATQSSAGESSGLIATPVRKRVPGQRLVHVFWKVVGMELLWFLVDVFALVFFVLLHAVPHRAYTMWWRVKQTEVQASLRRQIELLAKILEQDRDTLTDENSWEQETARKEGTNRNPTRAQSFCASIHLAISKFELSDELEAVELLKIGIAIESRLTQAHDEYIKALLPVLGVKERKKATRAFLRRGAPQRTVLNVEELSEEEQLQAALQASLLETRGQTASSIAVEEEPQQPEGLDAQRLHIVHQWHEDRERCKQESQEWRNKVQELIFQKEELLRQPEKWKFDVDKTKIIVFQCVGQFAYDVFATICFALTACTIYRLPCLLHSVYRAKDRRLACIKQLGEVFVDVAYFFGFIAVILLVRHAVTMPMHLLSSILTQPSFRTCRKIILHYLEQAWLDLAELLSFLVAWRTYKFLVASSCWGFFAPAVLLDTGYLDKFGKAVVVGTFLTLCAVVYGFPFVLVFRLLPVHVGALYCYWTLLALLLLTGAAMVWRTRKGSAQKLFTPARFLPLNWMNFITCYFGICFEALLLACLAISTEISFLGDSAAGTTLRDIAGTILGTRQLWGLFPWGFWLSFVAVLLYYVLASLPVVLEDILQWRTVEPVSSHRPWLFATEALGRTVFVFIIYNLTTMLTCRTVAGAQVLLVNPEVRCWEGLHRRWALVALLQLVFYVPTSTANARKLTEESALQIDIHWNPQWAVFGQAVICTWTVLAASLADDTVARLTIGVCGGVLLGIALLVWPSKPTCSVETIAAYRTILFVVVAIIHAAGFVARSSSGSWVPLIIALSGIGAGTIGGFAAALLIRRRRSTLETSATEIQRSLLELELRFVERRLLSPQWPQLQSRWRSEVRQSIRVGQLATQAVRLESHLLFEAYSMIFYNTREDWKRQMQQFVNLEDDQLEFPLGFNDNNDVCDCSFSRSRRQTRETRLPLPESFERLSEGVQQLSNGIP
eukprot:TRINITY_DN6311_c0_g1_i2.p1 TRINITY_DN6311_c0_g1~~TRINITY_DN6311_c0_g1_i2.p1  ORF type:complete len:1028 (-),score=187.24 TRINITY_DN6311_c0_g1_i2:3-3086(-)